MQKSSGLISRPAVFFQFFILHSSAISHQPSAFSHQNGPYPMQLVVLMAVIIDEMMLARICNTVFQVSFFMSSFF
jgi:hypothetical protein